MVVFGAEYIAVDGNGYISIVDRFQDPGIGIPHLYTYSEPLFNFGSSLIAPKIKTLVYNILPGGIE